MLPARRGLARATDIGGGVTLPRYSPPRFPAVLPRGPALWDPELTRWTHDNTDGLFACDLMEAYLRLTKGNQRGEVVRLRMWQGDLVCDILRTDAFGARESDVLEPGPADAPPLVVPVAGVGFGVLTCYDLRFPESARRLVDAGAEVLVVPAAWVDGPLKAMQWRALAVARAIENTAVVVAVGMAGRGLTGRSLVVGPDGVVGLELDEQPGIRTVDLDVAQVGAVRAANPSLANRRYRVVPA